MIQLALRDDDMNFFTKVEDIEFVYKDFAGFPVSFAVIPAVKDISTKGACPETRGNETPRPFEENHELVAWLKAKLASCNADVLLHGINHDYKYINGERNAEMQWRDGEINLEQLILNHKRRLENALDYKISCFVAPSNKITKKCLNAAVSNGMDYSGIVPLNYERNLTFRNIGNYLKRWWHRAIDRLAYPGVLRYSDHLEVNACLLQSGKYLRGMFDYCERHELPMVVNVHYWHLRDNPSELEMLRSFIMDYAIPKGAKPATVSAIFDSYRKCHSL